MCACRIDLDLKCAVTLCSSDFYSLQFFYSLIQYNRYLLDNSQQLLEMPLNDERPTSTSTVTSEDQNSDTESSERCDSLTSCSDVDCSRQSFTSNSSSKHNSPSCKCSTDTHKKQTIPLTSHMVKYVFKCSILSLQAVHQNP